MSSGYSIIVYPQTLNRLIEKTTEYNKPLCLTFVNYKKSFESVKYVVAFNSL